MRAHPWDKPFGKHAEEFTWKARQRDTWWTEEKIDKLRRLAQHHHASEIARIMGKSRHAITSKALREGVTLKKAWRYNTRNKVEHTIRRHAGKLGALEIGEILGMSRGAVQAHASALRISLRRYGEKNHVAKVSNADVELCRALRDEGLTVSKIAEKMELSTSYVNHVVYYEFRLRDRP